MAVDAADAVQALDKLLDDLESATKDGVEDGAHLLQGLMRETAPHLSGELAGSVSVTGPYPVVAGYAAKVGPTLVYGRIREIGGPIPGRRTVMTHPFLRWYSGGQPVFARRVHQKGSHYALKAVAEIRPVFRSIVARRWADALRSV